LREEPGPKKPPVIWPSDTSSKISGGPCINRKAW